MAPHKSRQPITRRDALCRIGNGFGMLAFAGLVGESIARAAGPFAQDGGLDPRKLDHPARAKRVIFLFMNGGLVAGRQLRSQADARQVPRPAAARRHDRHRAQDRRADAVAVHVQEVRQERHRGQRAVPARRRVRRRHLLHPLDVHRHPEPRAVDADDEHRPHAGRPAVARLVADLRPRHREPEPARLRRAVPGRADDGRPAALEQRVPAGGAPGHLHRRQGREADRHGAGRQGLRSEDADLLHPQREVHADRAAARARPARPR